MTLRLFLAQPTTIFAARVAQGSFAYPIAQVTFDGVTTGAYGDIEAGMTVLFGSSAGGDEYGRQRVRKAAGAATLYFGRSSRGTRDGEVDLVDNAYISVWADYRVWSKIPCIDEDGTIYKDQDIAVGTYTTNPPPVANAGVPMAGTIASGTSKLRVTLPGTGAKACFAVSGSVSSYAWTLPSGVSLVAGYALSDSQIEVDCDPGFYWIKLVVTDSNAETHTARVPIYARDPASDTSIASFTIENRRVTPQGQRLAVRILEDIAESTYPDGTLVMLWEDEPSTGADRSHMVFWGWHHTDPATISAERTGITRDTVFDCLDVAGKLDSLPGFPLSVEVASSPTTWAQMTAPNMDKYLHYLLHWHSTALEVADWSWSGTTTTYPFVVLGNSGQSLWDQLARRAKALVPDYVLGCNTLGQLQTVVDPMLQDTGSRTATVQATLEEADWSSIRYTHQRPPRAHWLRGEAVLASNTTISAVFCIAPGESPGQGESGANQGEQLAASQSALNACEGHRYARHNAPQGYFNILLAEGDDKGIEPADMTWVRLNVSSDTAAQRGLTFSNERGLVREMNVRYDQGRTGLVKTVELLWERETSGTPAVTVLMPGQGLPDPEWEPPDLSYDPEPEMTPLEDPPQQPASDFSVGQFYTTQYYDTEDYWTDDITASPPTWNTIDHVVGKNKTCLMPGSSANRFFGYGWGLWEYTPLPFDEGSWSELYSEAELATEFGHGGDYSECYIFRMQFSHRSDQERWAWAGVWLNYTDGGGDEHVLIGCLHTQDAWGSVKYATEIVDFEEGVDVTGYLVIGLEAGLALDMHSNTTYICIAKEPEAAFDGWWRLYRSQDFGYSFALAQQSRDYVHGTDGYGVGRESNFCDVWVPWVSDTYAGGTVFWTVTMMDTANNAWEQEYPPMVYRSQNHGLSRTDIGDDGGLASGLNFLGGPYNSAERVYGGISTFYGRDDEMTIIYTWRDGYGWTEFRDTAESNHGNCQAWIVGEQSGYTLVSGFAYQEPYFVQSGSDEDKQTTEDDVFWMSYVP